MMDRSALLGTRRVSGRGRPVVGDLAPLDLNHCLIACPRNNVTLYHSALVPLHSRDVTE